MSDDVTLVRKPYIVVNIDGIQADTRLVDLSVGQFAELLSQLLVQLNTASRTPSSDDIDDVIRVVREMVSAQTGPEGPITETVRLMQRTILESLPEAFRTAREVSTSRAGGSQ